MPRIEGNRINSTTSELNRALKEIGFTIDPRESTTHFTTPHGDDVFVTSRPNDKGILSVTSVVLPTRVINAEPKLGGVLEIPMSTSNRQPGEEGA